MHRVNPLLNGKLKHSRIRQVQWPCSHGGTSVETAGTDARGKDATLGKGVSPICRTGRLPWLQGKVVSGLPDGLCCSLREVTELMFMWVFHVFTVDWHLAQIQGNDKTRLCRPGRETRRKLVSQLWDRGMISSKSIHWSKCRAPFIFL